MSDGLRRRGRADPVEERLHRAMRDDCPRILSVLAARFGDLDLADEAVQDALVDAARTWPTNGVPPNVGGWLMTTARRRAIDRLRAADRAQSRVESAAVHLDEQREAPDVRLTDMIDEPHGAGPTPGPPPTEEDERLRLILLCCHPALASDAQVALTLRLVGGLTSAEISAAFLVPEPTLAQRIVRAKNKIKTAGIPLSMPEQLTERLGEVLAVLYLIFNEGYLSHDGHDDPIRPDLVDEAIRLTRLVTELADDEAEPLGLLALQLFHRSRHATRLDALGDLVLLDEQDRTAWDGGDIDAANAVLGRAMALMQPGPYQVQALIAAHHANAVEAADTDWPAIAALYAQLAAMSASPVVKLNRAVAVAMSDGPLAGLHQLEGVTGLDDYHLLWATRAELNRRAGRVDEAREAFAAAVALAPNGAERRHLERRLGSLG
ncbi:MAG: DUF6596 domain-containing protein [Actinomycetota bacterium]